jgi:ribosomal protein S1
MEKIQGTILTVLNNEKICLVESSTDTKENFVLSMSTLPRGIMVSAGDTIEFEPNYLEGNILIASNPVLVSNAPIDEFKLAMENMDILRAEVINFNNGGLELYYKGVKCFMPYSMTMISKDESFGIERIMNTEIDFQIVNIIVLTTKLLFQETETVMPSRFHI